MVYNWIEWIKESADIASLPAPLEPQLPEPQEPTGDFIFLPAKTLSHATEFDLKQLQFSI